MLRADDPLTTEEGWRRVTEHQPQPPELLTASDLDGLTAAGRGDYDEARKEEHAGLPMVNTPVIQKVTSAPGSSTHTNPARSGSSYRRARHDPG